MPLCLQLVQCQVSLRGPRKPLHRAAGPSEPVWEPLLSCCLSRLFQNHQVCGCAEPRTLPVCLEAA